MTYYGQSEACFGPYFGSKRVIPRMLNGAQESVLFIRLYLML